MKNLSGRLLKRYMFFVLLSILILINFVLCDSISALTVKSDYKDLKSMPLSTRWELVTKNKLSNKETLTKNETDKLQTTIHVKVWNFKDNKSMTKVTKVISLKVNKYLEGYFKKAFDDIYNSKDKPVIDSINSYNYRFSGNNLNVLSSHAYGIRKTI